MQNSKEKLLFHDLVTSCQHQYTDVKNQPIWRNLRVLLLLYLV